MATYEEALALFHSWTKSDSLIRHAYAVEAGMRFYSRLFGADEELWRMTGLLHDMDYEKHPDPDEHPYVGVKVLEKLGYPREMRTAILGHADHTGVPRTTRLAHTLYAVDELAGFITAIAYVRPTRLEGMTPKSVKKKLKDKAFAAAVNREEIQRGAVNLGVELDEHIAYVIAAMQEDATRMGLVTSE